MMVYGVVIIARNKHHASNQLCIVSAPLYRGLTIAQMPHIQRIIWHLCHTRALYRGCLSLGIPTWGMGVGIHRTYTDFPARPLARSTSFSISDLRNFCKHLTLTVPGTVLSRRVRCGLAMSGALRRGNLMRGLVSRG